MTTLATYSIIMCSTIEYCSLKRYRRYLSRGGRVYMTCTFPPRLRIYCQPTNKGELKMGFLEYTLIFIVEATMETFIGFVSGLVVVYTVGYWYKRRKYGDWVVVVTHTEEVVVERHVGIKTAEVILEDLTELSRYLKGVFSHLGRVHVDLVTEGFTNGVLRIDRSQKRIYINLDVEGAFMPYK